jgi:DNA transformation protein
MFGGWGLSLDGLTFAIIADLGDGEKLWLKADARTVDRFEAAGGQRFTMTMQKKDGPAQVSMGYYSAPVDAMESSLAMAPWARLALGTALQAQSLKTKRKPSTRRKANQPPGA